MTFKLLALDIDGTLIGAEEKVAPEVVDAVAAAGAAGLGIVLATGRMYDETVGIWRQLRLAEPYQSMVLASGAMVAEPDSGRTLYQKTIPLALALRYSEALADIGYTTVAFFDPWRHGLQYVVAKSRDAEYVRRRWFSRVQAEARWVDRLADFPDMPSPLHLSAMMPDRDEAEKLAVAMKQQFDEELCINTLYVPAFDVTVVEATAQRASKWTALMYVAQGTLIRPAEIAAVGDDTNDLEMIARAGLGAAMPHAPQCVRDAADYVAAAGLPAFIHELLAGKFTAE